MTIFDYLRTKSYIRKTARYFGMSNPETRREIQAAIDAAWEQSRQDPAVRGAWDRYFPDGKKPTMEEFIDTLASHLKTQS